MVKIQSSINSTEIYNLKNVLENNGIQCEVRGEYRRSAMGEIPIGESYVELWLLDDALAESAREILSGAALQSRSPWTCATCGESIEAEFDQCWNCLTSRTSTQNDE